MLTFAGMTRSGLYLHAVTTGASTLIGRTFGITFRKLFVPRRFIQQQTRQRRQEQQSN